MKRGILYVFTGPSGTGKGTILRKVMQEDERLCLSVSATTRAPRVGEQDGVHYFFLTQEAFTQKIETHAFLEYAEYAGNFYGTLESQVESSLAMGKDVILEIEVQGATHIAQKRPDAVKIFVKPPSLEALEERLHHRATETEEEIAMRMHVAEEELRHMAEFDYMIENREIEQASRELAAIFIAERCRNRSINHQKTKGE